MADEQSNREEEFPAEECVEFEEGQCSGPVTLRPGIRLANMWTARCEHHHQEYLRTAKWEGVHEQQSRLAPEEEE